MHRGPPGERLTSPRQKPNLLLLRANFSIILEKIEGRNIAENIYYIFSFSGFVRGIIPGSDTKNYDIGRHPEGTYILGSIYGILENSAIIVNFRNFWYL